MVYALIGLGALLTVGLFIFLIYKLTPNNPPANLAGYIQRTILFGAILLALILIAYGVVMFII